MCCDRAHSLPAQPALGRNPAISIIIPVYNRRELLGRALRSVIRQTFRDFEVLVIDDGSEENYEQLIDQFGDPRIKFLRHAVQCGAASARNTGLKAARGFYIAFLDSDDEWLPDKLQRQLVFMTDKKSECDVSTTAYFLDRGGSVERRPVNHYVRDTNSELLWGCALSPGSTLMITRARVAEVGPFDERLKRLEDWDWLLRLANYAKIAVLNEPLSIVFVSSDYVNSSHGLNALRYIKSKQREYGISPWQPKSWLKFRSTLLLERSAIYYRDQQYFRAVGYGMLCLVLYPMRNMQFFRRIATIVSALLLHGTSRPNR